MYQWKRDLKQYLKSMKETGQSRGEDISKIRCHAWKENQPRTRILGMADQKNRKRKKKEYRPINLKVLDDVLLIPNRLNTR